MFALSLQAELFPAQLFLVQGLLASLLKELHIIKVVLNVAMADRLLIFIVPDNIRNIIGCATACKGIFPQR